MSAESYHALKGHLSSSGIKQILDCPRQFHWWQEHGSPDPNAKPLRVGGALHSLLLDDIPRVKVFRETAGMTSKAAERFMAENKGYWCISASENEEVRGMSDDLKTDPRVMKIIDASQKEIELYWEEEGGIKCKAMLDILHPKYILDLKSTSRSLGRFQYDITDYRYDIQEAWYRRGLKACYGWDLPFYFIAMRNTPAWGHVIRGLLSWRQEKAEADINQAIEIFKTCSETGLWPGYSQEIIEI